MSGDSLSKATCPDCGAELESITDCFTGQAKHLDNFDAIEAELRDRGIVSDDEYDLYADDFSREEYESTLEELDKEPSDGPFIIESIVCTEIWCSNNDCGFSRRTHNPLPKDLSENDDTNLFEELDEFFETMEDEHDIKPSETAEEAGRNVAHLRN